jgi:CDP-diglyceride synthetase
MFRALLFLLAGFAVAGAGLALLNEYRKAFYRSPRVIMSLEVFFQLLRQPGPGWLAAFCLLAGTWMAGIGAYLAVGEVIDLFRQ